MKGSTPTSLLPHLDIGWWDQAGYSQGQEEMDSLVLPGEEAGAAEVRYDHRQEILMERAKTR